ncbi:MAG: MerR family transcriptional regulator, partial [Acidimicrobiales bacterium]
MADRVYLSIGDVLSLLQEEFPDVTISKIRFLESQGLLDPERTPSGYRKFYGADVERLRWILRQQRENFLPLKVIKGRLQGDGADSELEANQPLPLGTADPEPPAALVGAPGVRSSLADSEVGPGPKPRAKPAETPRHSAPTPA